MLKEAEQMTLFDQDTWSGRMSPELSHATAAETLQPPSKKQSKSSSHRFPICLCLRKDGQAQGLYTMSWGGWSVAWRVHDAQYWGVPQRRKRIALVADFGGLNAGEVLFERKGVSGNSEESGAARQGATPDAKRGAGRTDTVFCLQGNGIDRSDTAGCNGRGWSLDRCYTLNTVDRPAVVYDARGNGNGKIAPTITGDHENRITDYTGVVCECFVMSSFRGGYKQGDVASTLRQRDYKDATDLVVRGTPEAGRKYVVRRLTPMECERLQGYPDKWTEIGAWTDTKGKEHKESTDSARYKALGNSIALPFWFYLLRRISAQYERPATLGSLFDGIGGFPLCWERCNGPGTARWASEIEEFPIAVTKYHFEEEA